MICPICNGSGEYWIYDLEGDQEIWHRCWRCAGSGQAKALGRVPEWPKTGPTSFEVAVQLMEEKMGKR